MEPDPSGWSTRLTTEMICTYSRQGAWKGLTLASAARDRVSAMGDRVAVIDGEAEVTYRAIWLQARHLAERLRREGIGKGDVISFQLPNWHETMAINLAAAMLGAVCNPIVAIYRDVEVGFILKQSRAKVFFIPDIFRSMDYLAMLRRLRPGLPDLRHVILVRATELDGESRYEDWVATPLAEGTDALAETGRVDPDTVKLLLYTSGTTGEPKGVLHSHNTIRAEIDAVAAFWALTEGDTILMPSPVTHITGYLYALELCLVHGVKVVFMDRWEAARGARLALEHEVTFSLGSTPFLVELVAEVERAGIALPKLRLYASGGAPVPPEAIKRAERVLPNCVSYRVYGATEAPSVSLGVRAGDPKEKGAATDGFVFNHDVRIIDSVTGVPVPAGVEGEITTRGPEVMLGYTSAAFTAAAFDADGYFATGDLGILDADGYITITGRKKDLIIRGGENLSPKEIEDILHRHPAVLEAAVVGMPHERMGETPCAYVVARPGNMFDFKAMRDFLEGAQLARQKIPECLIVVPELPKTASGKVLKHVLKTRSAAEAKAAGQFS